MNSGPNDVRHEIVVPIQFSKIAKKHLLVLLRHTGHHFVKIGRFKYEWPCRKVTNYSHKSVDFSVRLYKPTNEQFLRKKKQFFIKSFSICFTSFSCPYKTKWRLLRQRELNVRKRSSPRIWYMIWPKTPCRSTCKGWMGSRGHICNTSTYTPPKW